MSGNQRDIALFMGNSRGHLYASFGLARRLQAVGRRVRFIASPKVGPLITSLGFEYQSLEVLSTINMPFGRDRRPLDGFKGHGLGWLAETVQFGQDEVRRFSEAAPSVAHAIGDLEKDRGPQTYIFDPFFLIYALPLIAKSRPVVSLSTKPLLTPDPMVPPYTRFLYPGRFLFQERCNWLWTWQRLNYLGWDGWEKMVSGASYKDLVLRFARQCGVNTNTLWKTRPVYFDTRFDVCPEWVLHAEEFEFPRRNKVQEQVYYLGPCVDTRRPPVTQLPICGGDGPLIFAVLSTVQVPNRRSKRLLLLNLFLELARRHPEWRMLISAGEQADQIDQSAIPQNARVVPFAPALEVLRSSKLLISQAGANLIKEAIFHGVPMLLLPDRADQPGNAARVVYHKLGLAIIRTPSIDRLDDFASRLLHDPSASADLTK